MSFTITRKPEQPPSYPMLRKLAEQNSVRITGDERAGCFSSSGVEGNYEFGANGVHATFAGHGVKGEFSFATGEAAVTISGKPYWLPETLLEQKIAAGLEAFCNKLA